MPDEDTSLELRPTYDLQLREFEEGLLDFLGKQGLPTAAVLVTVPERTAIFSNIGRVLARVEEDQRKRSIYISKFLAAVASGLFDAALNYLWDETISELRRRVTHYDLAYFFDTAVGSPERRKKLRDESDLEKIDDSELIHGAHQIGLVSDIGFKHLDYIKYMRNWASAAHPNQNQITGLQLISWLETCITEVINLPLSTIVGEIKRLLANIKTQQVSREDARQIAAFFAGLTQEQANNLAAGFFGIYTSQDTSPQTRQNINLLIPPLWDQVEERTRQQFGIRYGRFVANNDQLQRSWARAFLDIVGAASYIPQDLLAVEVETAVESLLAAHRGFNNFYTEPPLARELSRLTRQSGRVPRQVEAKYVLALVEVFLTNGNGVTFEADPIYRGLINNFDERQAGRAIISFMDINIASKLQFRLGKQKFVELIDLLRDKITAPIARELIEDIVAFPGGTERLSSDSAIKRKVARVEQLLG